MIIRKEDEHFYFIKQHDHADLALQMFKHWKDTQNMRMKNSLEIAIKEHDRAWIKLDETPRWNEKTNQPYSFMDYPLADKLKAYRLGIDEVVERDLYAGLLCSEHFKQFTKQSDDDMSKAFVECEQTRQKTLKSKLSNSSLEHFKEHYQILVFLDHLSLVFCLYDAKLSFKQQSGFIQAGIPLPREITVSEKEKLTYRFSSPDEMKIDFPPFQNDFSVNWKEKKVSTRAIKQHGLQRAYHEAKSGVRSVLVRTY